MNKQQAAEALAALEYELTPWVGDDEVINESVYEVTLTGKTINKVVSALQSVIEAGEQTVNADQLKRKSVEWYKQRFDNSDIIGMPSDREVLFGFIDHLQSQGYLTQPLSGQTAQPDVMGALNNIAHIRRAHPDLDCVLQPIEAALRSPGMVMVPVEPTDEMLNAAFDATSWPEDKQVSSETWRALRNNMAKEYKAMIAARPKS